MGSSCCFSYCVICCSAKQSVLPSFYSESCMVLLPRGERTGGGRACNGLDVRKQQSLLVPPSGISLSSLGLITSTETDCRGTKSQPQAELLRRAPQIPGATSVSSTKLTLVLEQVSAERELLQSSWLRTHRRSRASVGICPNWGRSLGSPWPFVFLITQNIKDSCLPKERRRWGGNKIHIY